MRLMRFGEDPHPLARHVVCSAEIPTAQDYSFSICARLQAEGSRHLPPALSPEPPATKARPSSLHHPKGGATLGAIL